ncbi:META domain-containing protein [Reichenbachiella versicolor]|uniref:META domain-containing protein n=1 Tax=Reichenbachiella versicolor TaxID=1821036 RepID=UPI000D6E1306|nr:META domain-containing protein [Reichenbachiella versicolor]
MRLYIAALLITILFGCQTKYELKEGEKYLWVYSLRTECDKSSTELCYKIKLGENPNMNEWESSKALPIGFEYEEGYIYRLAVTSKYITDDSVVYTMTEQVNKIKDQKLVLNDIWVLEKVKGESIDLSGGQGLPQLELKIRDMKFLGFDGCNFIQGEIEGVGTDRIEFGSVAHTMKNCPKMELGNQFRELLKETKTYKVKDLRLMLYNEAGEEILKMKKVD